MTDESFIDDIDMSVISRLYFDEECAICSLPILSGAKEIETQACSKVFMEGVSTYMRLFMLSLPRRQARERANAKHQILVKEYLLGRKPDSNPLP